MKISTRTICIIGSLAIASTTVAKGEFEPFFYAEDWDGTCAEGKMQSPINLPAAYAELPPVTEDLAISVDFPVVRKPMLVNTGHGLQVRLRGVAFEMLHVHCVPAAIFVALDLGLRMRRGKVSTLSHLARLLQGMIYETVCLVLSSWLCRWAGTRPLLSTCSVTPFQ
jgi:hypothetical protein